MGRTHLHYQFELGFWTHNHIVSEDGGTIHTVLSICIKTPSNNEMCGSEPRLGFRFSFFFSFSSALRKLNLNDEIWHWRRLDSTEHNSVVRASANSYADDDNNNNNVKCALIEVAIN